MAPIAPRVAPYIVQVVDAGSMGDQNQKNEMTTYREFLFS